MLKWSENAAFCRVEGCWNDVETRWNGWNGTSPRVGIGARACCDSVWFGELPGILFLDFVEFLFFLVDFVEESGLVFGEHSAVFARDAYERRCRSELSPLKRTSMTASSCCSRVRATRPLETDEEKTIPESIPETASKRVKIRKK